MKKRYDCGHGIVMWAIVILSVLVSLAMVRAVYGYEPPCKRLIHGELVACND